MNANRLAAGALRRYLAGDVVAIVAFVLAGQFRHGTDPLTVPGRFPGVLAPFLLGWVLAAPAVGAYRDGTLSSWREAVGRAVLAWGVAATAAQTLRGLPAFPGDADPVFYAVTLGAGGALLVGWRLVAYRGVGLGRA